MKTNHAPDLRETKPNKVKQTGDSQLKATTSNQDTGSSLIRAIQKAKINATVRNYCLLRENLYRKCCRLRKER